MLELVHNTTDANHDAPRSPRRFGGRFGVSVLMLFAILLLSACAGDETAAPVETGFSSQPPTEVAIVRILATVELPPTLSRIEKQQTRQAVPVTPTLAPPTAVPTETPYVGVFLGPAGGEIDPVRAATNMPEPTAEGLTVCALEIDPVFGTAWRANPSISRRIGCALQERFGFGADVQVFENGLMYRRQDTGEVWAIQPDQVRSGRFWYTNLPLIPAPISVMPPQGLRTPSEAFAGLWTSDPLLQQSLGFARTPQQVADINIQRVEGGTLVLDVTIAQVFILLDNGDALGPY